MYINQLPDISIKSGYLRDKNKNSELFKSKNNDDCFIHSVQKTKHISFSGYIQDLVLSFKEKSDKDKLSKKRKYDNEYINKLAVNVSRIYDRDVHPHDLRCIAGPDEVNMLIKNYKTENFVSTTKNQLTGTYKADLDCSAGKDVISALDKAALYADEYNKRTGEKFVLAITDTNSTESLKIVMAHISENSNNYENLIIIPGIKLSFAYNPPNSKVSIENSKLILYGIDPFSDNLNKINEKTYQRYLILDEFYSYIRDVYNMYEYDKNNKVIEADSTLGDFEETDLYLRFREFSKILEEDSDNTEKLGKFSSYIYSKLDTLYKLYGRKSFVDVLSNTGPGDKIIKKINDKYQIRYDPKKQKVISPAEYTYDELIELISQEKIRPYVALAAPYYYATYFDTPSQYSFDKAVDFINYLKSKSKGLLVAFESIAPVYDLDPDINPKEVKEFNDYVRKHTQLKEVGGSLNGIDNEELPRIGKFID